MSEPMQRPSETSRAVDSSRRRGAGVEGWPEMRRGGSAGGTAERSAGGEGERSVAVAEARSSREIPGRISLMGMPIDRVTEREAIGRILSAVRAGRGGWVITPNLELLRQYEADSGVRGFFERADLVLADGMPLVWASQIQEGAAGALPERVPGSGLIWSLTAAAAEIGAGVFLLGGNPGAAANAAARLREQIPGAPIVGVLCPPVGFEKDGTQMGCIREALRAGRPRIVYVGLGFPKQERLIEKLRDEFPEMWFLGIGISFSFVAGEVKRAPPWVQGIGLEWLHRLVQEPRRLFKRYVVNDLPFAVRLMTDAWRSRRAKAVKKNVGVVSRPDGEKPESS